MRGKGKGRRGGDKGGRQGERRERKEGTGEGREGKGRGEEGGDAKGSTLHNLRKTTPRHQMAGYGPEQIFNTCYITESRKLQLPHDNKQKINA